jgi:hypothetical protein
MEEQSLSCWTRTDFLNTHAFQVSGVNRMDLESESDFFHSWKLTKVKVKFPLCLINEALCHKDIWGSGGIAPSFFISALDGCEW